MDICILGSGLPKTSQKYRGSYRATPTYVESLEEDHPANQLFLWYCEEGAETGLVHDLAKAKELVSAYRSLQPSQYFELVEASTNSHHRSSGEPLGFDLSAGYSFSLLYWGLEMTRVEMENPIHRDQLYLMRPLLDLIQAYFQRKLNSNGLFDQYEDAAFCLKCMMALQGFHPGLWENEEVVFEVVGLWRIPA